MSWFTKEPEVEEHAKEPRPPYTIGTAIDLAGARGYNLYCLTPKISGYTFYEVYEVIAFNSSRDVLVAAAEHLGYFIK